MPKRFDPMTSEPERVLAEIIRARKRAKLPTTQREIATAVGVSQPCVSLWRAGVGMSKSSRRRIAVALANWRSMTSPA